MMKSRGQKEQKAFRAVGTIRSCCTKYTFRCSECPLHDEEVGCILLTDPPRFWRLPGNHRVTAEEEEKSKAILLLYPGAKYITSWSGEDGEFAVLGKDGGICTHVSMRSFPSIRSGQTVRIRDITGGAHERERVEFKRLDLFAGIDPREIKPCPGVIDETAALLGRQITETADEVIADAIKLRHLKPGARKRISKQDILEALHIHSTDGDCQLCPYQGPACTRRLTEDSLALLEEVMRE